MHELIIAAILGLVEGLTEFLPISSTGHLIITNALLGLSEERIKIFDVVVQLGAIMAVVVLYWPRFWGLLFPKQGSRFSGLYGIAMLLITCLPASVVGLVAGSFIHERLFHPVPVALSLAVGAVCMLGVESRKTEPTVLSIDQITPKLALGIGLFQCLALWPGFSRSASTIMGGMLLGADRRVAAEYSFIAAVPIMVAATGYQMLKWSSALSTADIPFFSVGLLVAFVSALAAVKVFVGLLGRVSLKPFAWYRLALAPLVYWFLKDSL